MSEKVKAKKAKSVAKKKSKTSSKKKTTTAKKKSKTKAVKKTSVTKTSKKAPTKKASVKKKATKNSTSKVKSTEELTEVSNPPLEEKFFNATLDTKEELNLEEKKVEDVVTSAVHESNSLNVKLSNSLLKKLKKQAMDEGISLEDFVSELLAESVVLRAWEIVERKNQMRSTPSQNVGNRSGNNNNHNSQSGNSRNRKGRMSHGRYQSIMDDKATFLEYVRNQERSRR